MADKYNIDTHKLYYHPERVAIWLKGYAKWETAKAVYPIYMEVSPVGKCNHRCVFCAKDFIGYKDRSLNEEVLRERLTEMAGLGVRAVMFSGEGEPTLWKPLQGILAHCTEAGISTALTTNMVPFNETNTDSILRNCSWIKTSINAGTAETYSLIHRTGKGDFEKVLQNFRLCVELRREKKYGCTIGAQMLLLPENAHEAMTLGGILREIGIDYLVIKPYSQHLSGISRKYENIDYRPFMKMESELKALNTESFSVIFRAGTIKKLFEGERAYQKCHATPFFWGYIMSDGCVYGCSSFLNDERFNYGNINTSGFKEIWEGEKRRACYLLMKEFSTKGCRKNCRMDEINRYLYSLKHPGLHANFI